MSFFVLELDSLAPGIDLDLCLRSGQVFRWVQTGESWVGVDGEHRYEIRSRSGSLLASGLGTGDEFVKLFALDGSWDRALGHLLEFPEIRRCYANIPGARMLRPSDPLEALFCFLCTSNNHLSRIGQMVASLAGYGTPPRLSRGEGAGGEGSLPPLLCGGGPGWGRSRRDMELGIRGSSPVGGSPAEPGRGQSVRSHSEGVASADASPLPPRKGATPLPLKEARGCFLRWPSPERIAAISEAELRENGFGYRAATIPKVAEIIASDKDWLTKHKAMPYPELRASLMTLPGVGPKLADCIALYSFHRDEAVPVDTHLWAAALEHVVPHWKGQTLTPKVHQELGDLFRDRYGPYAAQAQFILYLAQQRRARAQNPRIETQNVEKSERKSDLLKARIHSLSQDNRQ